MAEEMRDHAYTPVADDDRVFVAQKFPTAGLVLDTPVFTDPAKMRGFTMQGFKVLIVDSGNAATASVEIQERVNGVWATKQSTGVGTATSAQLFDHNSEDRIQECRLKITPTTALPAAGGYIYAEILGKRDE